MVERAHARLYSRYANVFAKLMKTSVTRMPHVRAIAATADVRYARVHPIQVSAVRSITRTSNQRLYKWTAVAGFTVNTDRLNTY